MRTAAAAVVLAIAWPAAGWAATPARVVVDDVPLALSPAPVVQDAVVLLPLRPLAQHFQAVLVADRQTIEVRRADGAVFVVRVGRLEVWGADGLVAAVTEAPVQVVQGTTMIPRGAIDVLFGTLTVWNPQDGVLTITTPRAPVRTAEVPRPDPGPAADADARAAAAFVPEFRPVTEPPVVASGYVAAGLALAAVTSANARLQFRTHGSPEQLHGAVALSTDGSLPAGTGTITRATPEDTLMVGGVSVNDSPLSVHEQALAGAVYEQRRGRFAWRVFGGSIPGTASHLYGAAVTLEPAGAWLLQAVSVYDPAAAATIVKTKVARTVVPGLTLFAEGAWGRSAAGPDAAGWRAGMETAWGTLTASLSYLAIDPGYPALGNAGLFAGRSGPLLTLAVRPSAAWTISASASLLRGGLGAADRSVSSLYVHYRPVPSVGIVAEGRMVEDTAGGVRTRSTVGQVALTVTSGPWGLVLAASQTADAGVLTGSFASTATVSGRLGYTLRGGLPLWLEVSRTSGDASAWSYGVGSAVRLSGRTVLNAQVRHKVYAAPSTPAESSLELSLTQPLRSGAEVTLGGGVRSAGTAAPAPYLTVQYGLPLTAYGPPRAGTLAAVTYVDRNGNGRRDADEPGLDRIVISIDGRRAAISDDRGEASVAGVPARSVTVAVDEATVPAGLIPLAPARTVPVAAGQTQAVSFGFVPAASLAGSVFLDVNANGVRDEGEQGVAGVTVRLAGTPLVRTTDEAGEFSFDLLLPGTYVVAIEAASLPAGSRERLNGGSQVTVAAGAAAVLHIPIDGRPVVRTF